jgi:hypothetical protein
MKNGKLVFEPYLLSKKEFLNDETQGHFILINGTAKVVQLEKDSLAFTVCQVPVIYKKADSDYIEVYYKNGTQEKLITSELSIEITNKVIHRTDEVVQLNVYVNETNLR